LEATKDDIMKDIDLMIKRRERRKLLLQAKAATQGASSSSGTPAGSPEGSPEGRSNGDDSPPVAREASLVRTKSRAAAKEQALTEIEGARESLHEQATQVEQATRDRQDSIEVDRKIAEQKKIHLAEKATQKEEEAAAALLKTSADKKKQDEDMVVQKALRGTRERFFFFDLALHKKTN